MIDLRPLYFFTQGAVADVRIVVTEMRLAKLSFVDQKTIVLSRLLCISSSFSNGCSI